MGAGELRLILFGFLLAFLSSFGQTFFIALFGGEIRTEFGLTHGTFGTFYSLATLTSGLSMLWVGAVLDRMSLLHYATVAIVGLAAACLLLASSGSVVLLVLALFGLRLAGQGMLSHAAATGMARAFTATRGRAVALATLGHPTGEAVLPIIAVALVAGIGWRNVWLAAAALALLALPLLLLLGILRTSSVEPRPHSTAPDGRPSRSYTRAEVLRDRRFHLIVPAVMAPSFIVTGLFFHQVYLIEVKGWELAWFASCFAGYAAASTGALMLSGVLIDRVGAVRLMPLYLLPLATACALLALASHHLVALGFMILAGLTSGAAITIVTAMWAEVYGVAHLGAIRALAASIGVVSSALAPASMGWLIDMDVTMETIAFGSALYCLVATLLVAASSLAKVATTG